MSEPSSARAHCSGASSQHPESPSVEKQGFWCALGDKRLSKTNRPLWRDEKISEEGLITRASASAQLLCLGSPVGSEELEGCHWCILYGAYSARKNKDYLV